MSITPEQKKQLTEVSAILEKTLEQARPAIGNLVTELGEAGAHPLGLALALASASATVIASMGVSANIPEPALKSIINSTFKEAEHTGMETYRALQNLKAAGINPEEAAQIMQENAKRQGEAANE